MTIQNRFFIFSEYRSTRELHLYLFPYFGFSAVYFAAASVAAVGILIYWAVIGRTGIFSTLVMRKVRSVRLNQIEIDPRDVSSAYRRGEEIEFDDPQPNQKKDA